MRKPATLAAIALLLSPFVGCKKSPIEEEPEERAKVSRAQSELAEAQKATSEKLDEIRGQIATLRNAAAAQRAQPDFMENLAVATRLAGRLSAQAGKQQAAEAEQSVERLARALATLCASAPANRIQQHLERAEVRLAAGDLTGANQEVLAAAGEAYNPTAPALVPDVLGKLEKASVALDAGKANDAADVVAEVMEKTAEDPTAEDLATAHLTAIEGGASVDREAWPILMAQASQISNLLKAVEKRATPEPQAEPEASPAETETSEPAEASAPTPAEAEATAPGAAPAEPGKVPAPGTDSSDEAASESADAAPNTSS